MRVKIETILSKGKREDIKKRNGRQSCDLSCQVISSHINHVSHILFWQSFVFLDTKGLGMANNGCKKGASMRQKE